MQCFTYFQLMRHNVQNEANWNVSYVVFVWCDSAIHLVEQVMQLITDTQPDILHCHFSAFPHILRFYTLLTPFLHPGNIGKMHWEKMLIFSSINHQLEISQQNTSVITAMFM